MNVEYPSGRALVWRVGVHMTFVESGMLLGIMNPISASAATE